MACVIEGVDGRKWVAPEWMARNAAFFLIPLIGRHPLGKDIATRLQTIIDDRAPRIPLGDLLALPEIAQTWNQAVTSAAEAISLEDPLSWNDPDSHGPFLNRFRELQILTPRR